MPSQEISFLRTPADRFKNLPDWKYEPHYLHYGNLRMAYIDEKVGSSHGEQQTFLCLHGQPTWSYLYRRMIPVLLHHTTSGQVPSRRVVCPDLFGFGQSDKPTEESTYHFDFHRDSLLHLIRQLDLQNVTLVVQDWGGLIGLTLPLAEPTRFKRLIVMNTTLGLGQQASAGFLAWRDFSNRSPDMKIGALMGRSCKHLSNAEKDAYDAPYPDMRYKAGVRRFPNMVMVDPTMPGVEISKESLAFYQSVDQFRTEDVLVACGTQDPVFSQKHMMALAKTYWKNGCYYTEIAEAGHFVQEWGDQVAKRALDVFEKADAAASINGVQKISPDLARL
ncbi:hypothetical protein B0A52_04860 [Exophiala mesophila]|uniref:AB hydrolase-1 domain-containing protein n=1 Tax=Exophiala mesophila TaxID=212818 RepID=A0A438N683_EXOME|nr:hypothetical protein B0A52_04860 [Exophiala mesophila]